MVTKGKLNLSSLAIVPDDKVRTKGGQRLDIPVSIFRRADLFSKKTRQIKRGVAGEAIGLVSVAYQSALTGVARSLHPEARESVQSSMKWPGPNSRSSPSKVDMRTSGGTKLKGDVTPDTDLVFRGYTSATLRRYNLSREYEFEVEGIRDYRRPLGKGRFPKFTHQLRVSRRKKFAFDARKPGKGSTKTGKVAQLLLGPGSPAVSAAAGIKLVGELESRRIGKNGRLPVRFKRKAVPGFDKKQAFPVATLSGPIGGFEKAVNRFAQAEAMFLIPFLTGKITTLDSSIVFPGVAGVEQATAVITKNELERPYIRRFMAGMNKIMIRYVADNLRR